MNCQVIKGRGLTYIGTEAHIGKLGNALISAVASLEVQDSRPVVGKVFGKGAARTGRLLDEIVGCWVHVDLE